MPSRFPLPASRSLIPSFCLFSLPFLLPLLNAASRRRLAKQNHCALQYRRPIADVEGIGELKLVSHCSLVTIHYSLFTAKPSPFGKPKSLCATIPPTNCRCRRNPGVEIGFITHHSSFIILPLRSPLHCFFTLVFSFNCLPLLLCGESWFSRFLLPAPVITCYCGEANPKLSIKSACCAISPCICPVFTGNTVSQ